jgi:hypothetical protein
MKTKEEISKEIRYLLEKDLIEKEYMISNLRRVKLTKEEFENKMKELINEKTK